MGFCRPSSTITIATQHRPILTYQQWAAVNPGATPSSPARYRKSIAYRGHWREQRENIHRWLLSGKIWSPDVKQKTQKIIWSERGSLLNHRTLAKNSFSLRERMKAEPEDAANAVLSQKSKPTRKKGASGNARHLGTAWNPHQEQSCSPQANRTALVWRG